MDNQEQKNSEYLQHIKIISAQPDTPEMTSFGYNHQYENERSQECILGNSDHRKQVTRLDRYPYSTIGALIITIDAFNQGTGTAFLIAPNLLLTAAHNIYDWDKKIRYLRLQFIPAGKMRKDALNVKVLYLPKEYIQKGQSDYDFALLEVQCQNLYQFQRKYGYLGTKFQCQNFSSVEVCGFPGKIMDNLTKQFKDTNKMFKASGQAWDEKKFIKYKVDTTPGQSGSPVLINQKENGKYGWFAVGIHIGGGLKKNTGLKLRQQIKQKINQFTKKYNYAFQLKKKHKKPLGYYINQLQQLKNLVKISIKSQSIQLQGIKLFQRINCEKIKQLYLQECELNQEAAELLSNLSFPQLEVLNLDGNKIRDRGVRAIASSPWKKLQIVSLLGTQVQNYQCITKADWPKLKILTIDKSFADKIGVQQNLRKIWPVLVIEN